jgi:hypothetical protein
MRRRVAKSAIWLAFTAALWLGAMPALAQGPTLVVFNPHPNDRVITGSLVMQGVAYDPDSADGPAIDAVSVSVCGRDGRHLGDAVLGLPSGVSIQKGDPRFAKAGWKVTVPLKGAGEIRSLCVTALGSIDGEETLVRIPITVGETPPPPPGPPPGFNPEEAPEPGEVITPATTAAPSGNASKATTAAPATTGSAPAPKPNSSTSAAPPTATPGTPANAGASAAPPAEPEPTTPEPTTPADTAAAGD